MWKVETFMHKNLGKYIIQTGEITGTCIKIGFHESSETLLKSIPFLKVDEQVDEEALTMTIGCTTYMFRVGQLDELYSTLKDFSERVYSKAYLREPPPSQEPLPLIYRILSFEIFPSKKKSDFEMFYLGDIITSGVFVNHSKSVELPTFVEIDGYKFSIDIFDQILARFQLNS
jgi:hypothetical protein